METTNKAISDNVYYILLGIGSAYVFLITIAKIINANRTHGYDGTGRKGKITLSTLPPAELLGRINELEINAEEKPASKKRTIPHLSKLNSTSKLSRDWQFIKPEETIPNKKQQTRQQTRQQIRPKIEKTRPKQQSKQTIELTNIKPIGSDLPSSVSTLIDVIGKGSRRQPVPLDQGEGPVPTPPPPKRNKEPELTEEPIYAQVNKRRSTANTSVSSSTCMLVSRQNSMEIITDNVFNEQEEPMYQELSQCLSNQVQRDAADSPEPQAPKPPKKLDSITDAEVYENIGYTQDDHSNKLQAESETINNNDCESHQMNSNHNNNNDCDIYNAIWMTSSAHVNNTSSGHTNQAIESDTDSSDIEWKTNRKEANRPFCKEQDDDIYENIGQALSTARVVNEMNLPQETIQQQPMITRRFVVADSDAESNKSDECEINRRPATNMTSVYRSEKKPKLEEKSSEKEHIMFNKYMNFDKPPVITKTEDIMPAKQETFVERPENPEPGIFLMTEEDFIKDIDNFYEQTVGIDQQHFCELCEQDVFHIHKKTDRKPLFSNGSMFQRIET